MNLGREAARRKRKQRKAQLARLRQIRKKIKADLRAQAIEAISSNLEQVL